VPVKSVSVIIPVYNHAGTVAQAIDSALIQEFDGVVEIIATNDGSTDRTQEVLDSFAPRIKVIRQGNRGNAAARNAAVAQAQGEYLAFLDADDIWLPGRLSKTVAKLEANPRAVLAFSQIIPMSQEGGLGQPWVARGAPSMEQVVGMWWGILPSATTMRRAAFDACGGFEEQLRRHVDFYFWMLAREQGEFEYVAEPLVIYRVTPFEYFADNGYLAARAPFVRLVRARYGRAVARYHAKDQARICASSLLSKCLVQRRNRANFAALWTLARVTRLIPSYSEKVHFVQGLSQNAMKKVRERIRARRNV
jgi:glycosyltransferase involved in cell wall biosynthesis